MKIKVDAMYNWFQTNLDFVFFIYGLVMLIMGLTILIQPKKDSQFELANIFWLFVAYALVHSPSDFIHMWESNKGENEFLHCTAEVLTSVSYLFLFEFGRRLNKLSNIHVSWWVLPILALISLGFSLFSGNSWSNLNILMGYLIRFPAGLMTGLGFRFYYYSNREDLKSFHVRKYFLLTGIVFLAWAFFCGLVRAKGGFFPANLLNIETFFSNIGIPVYVFRSICAIGAVIGITGILRIFTLEGRKKLDDSLKRERKITLQHEMNMAKTQTRNRIARNLHDEIGATVSGITHFAKALAKDDRIAKDSKLKKTLSLIVESSTEAQEKMRDLIWTIDPENDNWDLLMAKFHRHASDLFDSLGIQYKIELSSSEAAKQPTMAQRQHLWLIFKEMVNNILKHSQCAKVEINMLVDNPVQLTVMDDGVGFNPNIATEGVGIANIRTRAENLEAVLSLKTAANEGTTWDLKFDLQYSSSY